MRKATTADPGDAFRAEWGRITAMLEPVVRAIAIRQWKALRAWAALFGNGPAYDRANAAIARLAAQPAPGLLMWQEKDRTLQAFRPSGPSLAGTRYGLVYNWPQGCHECLDRLGCMFACTGCGEITCVDCECRCYREGDL